MSYNMPETIIKEISSLMCRHLNWINENPEFRMDKINAIAHYANMATAIEIAKMEKGVTDPIQQNTLKVARGSLSRPMVSEELKAKNKKLNFMRG